MEAADDLRGARRERDDSPTQSDTVAVERNASAQPQPPRKRMRKEAADHESRIGISFSVVAAALGHDAYAPFCASLKTLCSDFIVREQTSLCDDGAPLRLTSFELPAAVGGGIGTSSSHKEAPKRAQEEGERCQTKALDAGVIRSAFVKLLPESALEKLLGMAQGVISGDSAGGPDDEVVTVEGISDKATRAAIHGAVKAVFAGTFVSSADDGKLCIRRANAQLLREHQRRSRSAKDAPPPQFLHFTLYKENLDSTAALRTLAQQLGVPQRSLQFSGTKDKRGVTLQRVACRGLDPQRLLRANRCSCGRNALLRVGNLTLHDTGLSLGDLRGNTFEVVLRVVDARASPGTSEVGSCSDGATAAVRPGRINREAVNAAVDTLREFGFVNYFGPQRFGTTSVLTSDVGIALLSARFRDAILLMLSSKAEVSPELQPAIDALLEGNIAGALAATPHYCFQERDMLRHLERHVGDWRGAFAAIPRTLAMLYFHAVQSLAWNRMASIRLAQHGLQPVVGDLVLAVSAADNVTLMSELDTDANDVLDEGGATNGVLPAVRCLSLEDIAAGCYRLKDVVLPVPGPDELLRYPTCAGCTKSSFETLLREQLQCPELLSDPHGLARQYHFHGTYRALCVLPSSMVVSFTSASSLRTQVLETDYQKITRHRDGKAGAKTAQEDIPDDIGPAAPEDDGGDSRFPVVIASFGLPPGSYATSLLRELCIMVKE